MTETDKPFHKTTLGIVGACIIWTTQIGTAIIQVDLVAKATARYAVTWEDKANLYVSAGAIALAWLSFLLQEWINRYNRRKARSLRRLGLLTQALLLSLNALGGTKQLPDAFVALFFVFLSSTCWLAWMSTAKLHPDDQEVVDQLIAARDEATGIALAEQQTRERQIQLRAALASLRLTLPEPPEPIVDEPDNQVRWDIRRGRHTPVVYFIRNGNRIKIGTTTDLYQRIRRLSLRTDNVALLLSGGRDKERALHRQFAAHRIGNTEWFRDAAPLSDFITAQIQHLTTTSAKGSDSHE